MSDNSPTRIYLNKIENRITFRIRKGYHLELLMPETMKLLKSINIKITKYENGENLPHLEISEVVLPHCKVVNNYYQQNSRALHTLISNNFFDQLLDILPKAFIFLKVFNSEFLYIEVWFADQNSKSLKIEDKISITLAIKYSVKYKE